MRMAVTIALPFLVRQPALTTLECLRKAVLINERDFDDGLPAVLLAVQVTFVGRWVKV